MAEGTPTRSTGITVEGLREFRRRLREVGPEFPKALALAHRDIAGIAARVSQAEARKMGGVQRKAASAIRGRGSQAKASLTIRPSKSARNANAMANVAFWGAKKRTGWYAAGKFAGKGKTQHPEWIGNTWDVMDPTQGPYAINSALARYEGDLMEALWAAFERITSQAFPE